MANSVIDSRTSLTTAAASPTALTFASQALGTASSAQTVTLQNTALRF